MDLAAHEREKYERMWADPDYGKFSPGENMVVPFLQICNPWKQTRIIDFGCGQGKAMDKLVSLGFQVTGVDHVNVLINDHPFIESCLWEQTDVKGDFAYCIDVMEHIPEEKVEATLYNILKSCSHAFFHISFMPDGFGERIGEPLHLTVKPFEWWREKLEKFSHVKDARDLRGGGLFYVRSGGTRLLTVTEQEALANIEHCLSLGLPQVLQYEANDKPVLLLAGGPSLNDSKDEIIQRRNDGWGLATCNGTHQWALDHGLTPSLQFVVDGRELNAKFVDNPQKDCRYILSSKCHPKVFERLKDHDVRIFHAGSYDSEMKLLNDWYFGQNWTFVAGGSTVATRALAILKVLGFRKIEVYGLDSCFGEAHAYDQPENKGEEVFPVRVGDREFMCSAWQYDQAFDFVSMWRTGKLDDMDIGFHGDGLIAHIVRHGVETYYKEHEHGGEPENLSELSQEHRQRHG